MQLGKRLVYLLPNDLESVPTDKVGVYCFSLLFPSDYQLGLARSNLDLNKIKEQLTQRLNRYSLAFERVQLVGGIESDVHGVHLRSRYQLTAILAQSNHIEDMVEEYFTLEGLSLKSLKTLTEVLRHSFLFSSPIYIGMTASQSFRTRLNQHLDCQSNFGLLLKKQRITWAETKFECIPLDGVAAGGIGCIEKIVQNLFKPTYCLG